MQTAKQFFYQSFSQTPLTKKCYGKYYYATSEQERSAYKFGPVDVKALATNVLQAAKPRELDLFIRSEFAI